jgi:hypothetical protein
VVVQEPRVHAISRRKLLVRAHLGNGAISQDDDPVGALDRVLTGAEKRGDPVT